MSKIKHHSDWSSWDELDGKELEDGECLRIEWPNGRITEENICIHKGINHTSDHGHPCTYKKYHAYVNVTANGIATQVRIVGLEAERL